MDVKQQLEIVRAASPEAAEEIARRSATAKVLPTDRIAHAWPDARREILAKGSRADLSDAVLDA